MDWSLKRKVQLQNHIDTEIDLLKEYEDKLRTEGDPRQKLYYKEQITEIKERISEYENELANTDWEAKEKLFLEKTPEDSNQRNPKFEDEASLNQTLDKTSPKSNINQEGKEQISEAIVLISEILKEEKLLENDKLDDFYLLRLQLLTTSLLTKEIVSSMLDTHEINRLYLMRERLRLNEMIEKISKDRYRKVTLNSIENAFANLDNHEKLLLLYYHVENLKLREIAKLGEAEGSPLRGWFQRKSATREKNPESKIHESTILRWLEKSYAKVLQLFREELFSTHSLREDEVEICMEIVTEDLAIPDLYKNLTAT